MKAKEYLEQYEVATRKAARLKTEYAVELAQIDAVRSPMSGDGLPHGSGISKATEDKAVKLADKAAAWRIAELEALQIRQDVFETIHDIKGLEGEVLIERYINLRKWSEVCAAVNKSWNATHTAHRRGLATVQSIINSKK